ncbi:MAG: hypothetical protein B7Z37_15005 [Verrucomicrobia bacterium 12-59-8]|nr:MAG: hypothetical protein B7Z37_15005 [Verrucomicrobia bacterium 12-59-8]
MKPLPFFFLATTLVWCGTASAQTGSPRAKEVTATGQITSVVHDGIVYYRGQTYLIRNKRAALVDANLVPEGQVLTPEGRLVVLPTDFVEDISPTVREGLFAIRGQAYLIRNGRITRVNALLVPEGQVLTTEGQLLPLPSDFSGFVLDRAPDGTVLPTPPKFSGPQVLPGQAGVRQVEQGQADKK